MKRLDQLFDICYGSQLDLNKCVQCDWPEGFNFVNRSEKNSGVSSRILREEKKMPFDAGLITVAMGGSVLASFIQQEPFYTGQNVKVLKPKPEYKHMSDLEKLYYCYCIEANRFRFSTFGREANASFNSILVPDIDELPEWINDVSIDNYSLDKGGVLDKKLELNPNNWKWFWYDEIFDIYTSSNKNYLESEGGDIPYISSTQYNNGVNSFVKSEIMQSGNTITVARNGSVGSAFYHNYEYCASPDDVRIFRPKFEMNEYIALFLCTLIEKEKYRYTYGRKFGTKRMQKTKIKLPVTAADAPDWQWMEDYIKSLPYSKAID